MSEPEKKTGTNYEAFALYDIVREAIFNDYLNALNILNYINEQEAGGQKLPNNSRKVMSFKAYVIRLYYHLRDKLEYPKHPEQFRVLRNLDHYIRDRSLKYMSVEEAYEYFLLERTLIEVLGITKFERVSTDPTNWPAQKVGL